ncbi:transcriptional regulator [Limibaculum sp. FT325]|uniref:helix-turn-helix transcriptional regulator n=1 Tax=Thermohalobaculum sediminis TaxID=2939436 RepID=UPI0020BEA009|nr:transcriptional regulator [Limibaculum sediminis]MCL5779091.1 transcriptional regulator [Limibaculum sediminis]
MRYLTLDDLRGKLGGRSRNAIFADIDRGLLPRPIKLNQSHGGRNYWLESEVDEAMARLSEAGREASR